jgi:glycosyltransferase involved in cell wall biosynthesis
MSVPCVSVVMSVYNGERFLKYSIDSILSQSYSNFEFIIVNDGSTDLTGGILDSYTDTRIVKIKNNINLGLTKSLNKGIALAKGDYIARLDADDIAKKDRLELQVKYLDENLDISCIGSNFEVIDQSGKCFWVSSLPNSEKWLRWQMLFRNVLAHSSMMIRRSDLAEGAYDEEFKHSQDFELWCRLLKGGERIRLLPEALVQLRDNEEGITTHFNNSQSSYAYQITKSNVDWFFGGDIPLEIVKLIYSPYQYEDSTCSEEALEYLFSCMGKYFRDNALSDEDRKLILAAVITDSHKIVSATNHGYSRSSNLLIKRGANINYWKVTANGLLGLWGMKAKRLITGIMKQGV